ncbi:MAG: ABC transporter ATP-binding protein [Caldisphaera sp.]|uniref:ABC transporter ATP-binding protein n=1 Tax=Caldisphaera sp. TaxID=2060322 RepID=UPI0025BD6940|nr:ABC transporter ATP-binding protein [Caldisphaera sp.]
MNNIMLPGVEVPVDNNTHYSIIAEKIYKKIGKKEILKGVDLKIRYGEIHVIAGHNGAGKTTLFRILAGLLKYDSGKLSVLGFDPNKNQHEISKYLGYVPEDSSPYERLTGFENLRVFALIYSNGDEKIAEKFIKRGAEISELTHEDLSRKAGEYSNGMKKRLLIARAIMHNPKLVLLDEPTNGLDVFSAYKIRKLIKTMSSSGTTFVIATHNMSEAEMLADRITFIAYGTILYSGSVKSAIEDFNSVNLEEAFIKAVGEKYEV